MAISGIENINIGLQNEAAGSDSLFTAFHKSQNNFTTLFSCASPTTNFVAGDGVAVEYSNSNTYLTITNTGVTNLVAGDDSIVLTQSNGNITITAPGGGNGGGGGKVSVKPVVVKPVEQQLLIMSTTRIPKNAVQARVILEVPVDADASAIKNAFHRLSRKYHPDKHPKSMEKNATQAITRINRAYEILKE